MWINIIIETFFGIGLFINTILFVPQIIKLYQTKHSQGLSFITFAGFNLIQLFTILNAYLQSDLLFMLGYVLSFIVCSSVSVHDTDIQTTKFLLSYTT